MIQNPRSQPVVIQGGCRTIALAQGSFPGGRIQDNTRTILKFIHEAKEQGADVVVFPELCLPGYCAMDLFLDPRFLKENRKALNHIAAQVQGITALIGFADCDETREGPNAIPWTYNAAAVIRDGKILHIQHKRLLPNSDVFNEMRYFQPGAASQNLICFEDGTCAAVAICEDLWGEDHGCDLVRGMKEQGAELVLSLNASPYYRGRMDKRNRVLTDNAERHNLAIAFVNHAGSYDNYDGELVFEGRSRFVDAKGTCRALASAFTPDLLVLDRKNAPALNHPEEDKLGDTYHALILGIREFFERKGLKTALIGLSGGIDSAVVAALAVRALGAANVLGVTMPSHITGNDTLHDAHRLADNLGITCLEIPISEQYARWLESYKAAHQSRDPHPMARQNTQARLRHINLMALTNDRPGTALLNTGNKTEIALGYFTLGGDSGGALAVLGDVNKTIVYELANHLNKDGMVIPQSTIERVPTAELEEGQTDEGSLAASYDVLAPLVDALIETPENFEALQARYGDALVNRIYSLITAAEGKRRQMGPAIRITKKSFGMERRIPMDHRFRV